MEPRKYAIAYCSLNALGLILCDKPQPVTYSDGKKGVAWTGIQLSDKLSEVGKPWSSRNPRVIGYLDNLLKDKFNKDKE